MSETLEVYGKKIEQRIYLVRGRRVMLDSDLAKLYAVSTGNLNKALKRNSSRFPQDFAFRLTIAENRNLRFQFGSLRWGAHSKYLPYAFTEQGVAMLSSVLRSERAVQVNINIMRVFIRLRETLGAHKELALKLAELERRIEGHDEHIQNLFDAIHQLMNPPEEPRKQIGFHVRENGSRWGKSEPRMSRIARIGDGRYGSSLFPTSVKSV